MNSTINGMNRTIRSRKKICIIYTGGTIGMVRTGNGFAPKQGVFADELEAIRDLRSDRMPDWDMIEFDPLLDSSNITYEQWNQIAETIGANYDSYDGFVVLHGTDTMAYTASALSFMLEGLDKPVVFTGSQIPLCELRSDGKDNLITSVLIAADGMAREVSLYFSNKLLRGNRATKMSSDDLIAFETPNYPALARAGIDVEYNEKALLHAPSGSNAASCETGDSNCSASGLHVTKFRKTGLGVIKLIPGINFELFEPITSGALDGLVLETFGAGNIPSYDETLLHLISEASANDTIVVVCTQCPHGTVRLGAYEAGSELVRAGAVNGFNMTTEAATAKLSYLLSRGYTHDEIRRLMEEDLRGELDS